MDYCTQCGKTIEIGEWPFACNGSGDHTINKANNPNLHPTDQLAYYEHPSGLISTPGCNDRPMPQKFADAGYVRKMRENTQGIREHERRTGTISEALNYHKNSAAADRDTNSV